MQDKTNNKKVVMALVGVYLIYTGGSLIMEVVKGQPENGLLFIAAGVAFVIFGGLTAFTNMKSYIAAVKADVTYTDEEMDAEPEESMEEIEESEEQ